LAQDGFLYKSINYKTPLLSFCTFILLSISTYFNFTSINFLKLQMGSVTTALEKLKASLSETAVIVTPESDKYEESIKRWASSAERKAVCTISDLRNPLKFHFSVRRILSGGTTVYQDLCAIPSCKTPF
jgi:hypothetical protein